MVRENWTKPRSKLSSTNSRSFMFGVRPYMALFSSSVGSTTLLSRGGSTLCTQLPQGPGKATILVLPYDSGFVFKSFTQWPLRVSCPLRAFVQGLPCYALPGLNGSP